MCCKYTKLFLSGHSYVCRTDPADVARVESKTFVVTKDKHRTVPRALEGAKGGMGQWMSPEVAQKEMNERFRNCMAGMSGTCCVCVGPSVMIAGTEIADFILTYTFKNYIHVSHCSSFPDYSAKQ